MTFNPWIDLAVVAAFLVALGLTAWIGDKFTPKQPRQQATKI